MPSSARRRRHPVKFIDEVPACASRTHRALVSEHAGIFSNEKACAEDGRCACHRPSQSGIVTDEQT